MAVDVCGESIGSRTCALSTPGALQPAGVLGEGALLARDAEVFRVARAAPIKDAVPCGAGRWRLQDGRWKMGKGDGDGRWEMEMEDGRWEMGKGDGRWEMEMGDGDGKRRWR